MVSVAILMTQAVQVVPLLVVKSCKPLKTAVAEAVPPIVAVPTTCAAITVPVDWLPIQVAPAAPQPPRPWSLKDTSNLPQPQWLLQKQLLLQ